MTKEELEEQLHYEVIPDILGCMNEISKHNRQGAYGFNVEGLRLDICFRWTHEEEIKKEEG